MNIAVLKYLTDNDPSFVTDATDLGGHDAKAALGVAAFLLAHNGEIERLSPNQRFYWDKYIKPFLQDVPCEGVLGDSGACSGNGRIDNESLLLSYQDHKFLCQLCRYDREKIFGR